MELNLSRWDWELMVFLNNASPDSLNPFWSFVTYTEHWIPFYLLLLALFFYKSDIKSSVVRISYLLVCVGTTHFLTELTKYLVERPRPNATEEIMNSLKILYEPSNFSFFSGHASTSFATTIFIYLLLNSKFKYLELIFIWPILFSLSRIFVGVHFPVDVIVGGIVGAIIAILFSKLYFYSETKLLSVSN
ncbi:phosphatase PAP2 family protein [Psychroflexus salinarum]|uniref:Phosphatase PAP2 family protein n=1 Tax=Psychroflexus salinarum TaxID=546024 RepID=A0ABW3GQJ7_9FLAO